MNRFLKILNPFFFVAVFGQTLFAQNKLTVEQAITAALENNYEIKLVRNDSSSYALDNSYARAVFLPRINASTGLVYNNTNQLMVSAPITYQVLFNSTGYSLMALKCLPQEISWQSL
jgi:hypothetical protein